MKNLLDKYLKYGHLDTWTLDAHELDSGVCWAINKYYGFDARCIFSKWYKIKYSQEFIVPPIYLRHGSGTFNDVISNSTTRRIGLICEFMRSPYYFMNKEHFNFKDILYKNEEFIR